MPRRKREWFPGAMYHITARGLRRGALFRDEEDRLKFLSILQEAKVRFPFLLHAYCLMTNHIHLQIETCNHPVWKIMQFLNSSYGTYFNVKYHYKGHVFEKRYGAEVVDSPDYELELSRYIHLNPLKAGMVRRLEDYRWSSYRTYASLEQSPFVSTSRLLSYFEHPQTENYVSYILAAFAVSPVQLKNDYTFLRELEERL